MYDNYEVKTGKTATHLAHGYVTITTTAHLKQLKTIAPAAAGRGHLPRQTIP